jgi:hypothetical protein
MSLRTAAEERASIVFHVLADRTKAMITAETQPDVAFVPLPAAPKARRSVVE